MQSLLVNRLAWGFVISYTLRISFTREKTYSERTDLTGCVTGTVGTNIR
jgi:hypothetical protein